MFLVRGSSTPPPSFLADPILHRPRTVSSALSWWPRRTNAGCLDTSSVSIPCEPSLSRFSLTSPLSFFPSPAPRRRLPSPPSLLCFSLTFSLFPSSLCSSRQGRDVSLPLGLGRLSTDSCVLQGRSRDRRRAYFATKTLAKRLICGLVAYSSSKPTRRVPG
jgi:hypothetical protein